MSADAPLDLVFECHPHHGIVAHAFTDDPAHIVTAVLRRTGFTYDDDAGLHLSERDLPASQALDRMARATTALSTLGCTVRASPAVLIAMLGHRPATPEASRATDDAMAAFAPSSAATTTARPSAGPRPPTTGDAAPGHRRSEPPSSGPGRR